MPKCLYIISYGSKKVITVRPRGTRPHGTRTLLGHDIIKGSKIFEISDFGTQTSLGHDFALSFVDSLIRVTYISSDFI